MKKQELSIIIPVYNGENYIAGCLENVLNQVNIGEYEIVVVNDGSTDTTPDILKKFANKYRNIKVVSQPNMGLSMARNNGIAASYGKYVTFIDCDDLVGLNTTAFDTYFQSQNYRKSTVGNLAIENVRNLKVDLQPEHFDNKYFVNMLHAAADCDADVILGGKITINGAVPYLRRHAYVQDKVYGTSQEDKDIILRQADVRESANFALFSRKMLRKKSLRFSPSIIMYEDVVFCMLATLYSERVATVKDATYFYNRRFDTLSNIRDDQENIEKSTIGNVQFFSMFINELKKYPQYSSIMCYWTRHFSEQGLLYSDGQMTEFPPKRCILGCKETECTGCLTVEHVFDIARQNIATYRGGISY